MLSCQPYSITVGYCRKGYDKLDMQIYLVDPSNEEENSVDGVVTCVVALALDGSEVKICYLSQVF